MAIVTCLVGLHYGHIIVHFKDHRVRMLYWMIPSSYLVVCGLTLDLFGMHINKVLYSFSYTCVTAGAAGILFVGTYLMGLKDIIAETLSSGLDRSTSDAIMPDGIDKLEQQRRPLLRFELVHFWFLDSRSPNNVNDTTRDRRHFNNVNHCTKKTVYPLCIPLLEKFLTRIKVYFKSAWSLGL